MAGNIVKVPIVKAKGLKDDSGSAVDYIEINTDDPKDGGDLPANVYAEALLLGLKVMANRGTTKITKETYPNVEERQKAAMAKAQEQLVNLRAGKIRTTAKSDKVSGKVKTEARRIAKGIIKQEMKNQGIKVSLVSAKDITAAADDFIAENVWVIEQAKASIDAAEDKAKTAAGSVLANLKTLIPVDRKKEQALAEEKAKAKEQLSALQAGKTKTRSKAKA